MISILVINYNILNTRKIYDMIKTIFLKGSIDFGSLSSSVGDVQD